MLSKGAKRWIRDDITRFPQNFWQMTIARSGDISKDDTSLLFVQKTFSFRKHFGTVLTEEIRIAKFCTEVFVMPKHLMTKLNIPESSVYMSLLRAIVLSQQHCRITVIWWNIVHFAPLLNMRRCIVCIGARSSKPLSCNIVVYLVQITKTSLTINFSCI